MFVSSPQQPAGLPSGEPNTKLSTAAGHTTPPTTSAAPVRNPQQRHHTYAPEGEEVEECNEYRAAPLPEPSAAGPASEVSARHPIRPRHLSTRNWPRWHGRRRLSVLPRAKVQQEGVDKENMPMAADSIRSRNVPAPSSSSSSATAAKAQPLSKKSSPFRRRRLAARRTGPEASRDRRNKCESKECEFEECY